MYQKTREITKILKYFEKSSEIIDILPRFWLQYSSTNNAIWMQTTRMDSKIRQFMRRFQVDATADKVKYPGNAFTRDWLQSNLTVFVKVSDWRKLFLQALKKLIIGVHVFEHKGMTTFLHSRTRTSSRRGVHS